MEKLLSKWFLPVSVELKSYLSEIVFNYKWNWVYGHILIDYLLWELSTLNTELSVLLVFMNLLHILNTNLVQLHVKLSYLK